MDKFEYYRVLEEKKKLKCRSCKYHKYFDLQPGKPYRHHCMEDKIGEVMTVKDFKDTPKWCQLKKKLEETLAQIRSS